MKPASTALKAYLDGLATTGEALFADLITFSLVGGQVLRYSMAQYPLSPPASSFQAPDGQGNGASINYTDSLAPIAFPLGPAFSRLRTKVKLGLDPDRAELAVIPHPPGSDAPDRVGTLSWQEAALQGFFNGATVEIDRLFMPTIGDYSLGSFVLHLGRVGQMKIGRTRIDMEIPNLLVILTAQYPRRLFQPQCTWVFGDSNCAYNRTLTQQTITALSGSTQSVIAANFAASPASLYTQGTIDCLSGANAGISRTISNSAPGSPGSVSVATIWPYRVAAGDTFALLPGCDHTAATCKTVFNNFVNFGGFPYIPPPEAAV